MYFFPSEHFDRIWDFTINSLVEPENIQIVKLIMLYKHILFWKLYYAI